MCASFLLQLQYMYLQFQNMHGLMCTFVEIHVLVCTLRFLVTIAIHAPTVSKHARINVCCTNQFFKLTTVKPFAIYSSNIFLKLSQSQKFWWGFSQHPFLRTIFGWRFLLHYFWLENWKHKYAYWINRVTMCDQWNIILSSEMRISSQYA